MTRQQFIEQLLAEGRRGIELDVSGVRVIQGVTNPNAKVTLVSDPLTSSKTVAKETALKVGFYGCTNTLVKVGLRQEKGTQAPRVALVDCPACGKEHKIISLMFRKVKSLDEYELCDLHLSKREKSDV